MANVCIETIETIEEINGIYVIQDMLTMRELNTNYINNSPNMANTGLNEEYINKDNK